MQNIAIFAAKQLQNMTKNLSKADIVVYAVLLINASKNFVKMHYGKGLDTPGALACAVINFCIFCIIYIAIIAFWKYFIREEFLDMLRLKRLSDERRRAQEMMLPTATSIIEAEANAVKVDAVETDVVDDTHNVETQCECNEAKRGKRSMFPASLDELFGFAEHYLLETLNKEGMEIFKENIIALNSGSKTGFRPVTEGRFDEYSTYDIMHLCHAIGAHTAVNNSCQSIAAFPQVCFPGYFKNWELSSMSRKLTNRSDYATDKIAPIPKTKRLPVFAIT